MNSDEFTSMYLGEFPSDDTLKLKKLALEYHKLCEDYDRTICSCKDKYGVSMPRDGFEYHLVNQNAREILSALCLQAGELGFTKNDLWKAIRESSKLYGK